MKKLNLLFLAMCICNVVWAQIEIKLSINHLLGTQPFAYQNVAQNNLGNKFKVSRLEYYISNISILHDGGKRTLAKDVYILEDAAKVDTISLGMFTVDSVEAIQFNVGVDPGVNNGDPSLWPSTHPLAPKFPSMHWGWAAGYRFVALEGKSGNNFGFDFQIHALGNKNYFNQTIPVKGNLINNWMLIKINADYTKAVDGMYMENGLIEHSEDNEAATCLRLFQTSVFTNQDGQGSILGVNSFEEQNVKIYPNPSSGQFKIEIAHLNTGATVRIIDQMGRVTASNDLNLCNTFKVETPGIYYAQIRDNQKTKTIKIIVQ